MLFRLGELFCGPGGIAWGALNADIGNSQYKIIHQWASDYDMNTCNTYIENICPDKKETVYNPTLPRKLQKKSQKSEEYQRFSLLFLYSYVIII